MAIILCPGKTPDGAEVALALRHVIGYVAPKRKAIDLSSEDRSMNEPLDIMVVELPRDQGPFSAHLARWRRFWRRSAY